MNLKTLKKTHPFMEKVNKLYTIMEELNIFIDYGGVGGLCITDTTTQESYRLLDKSDNENLSYFPTEVEFKLSQYE
jgi:hypothetical protein